VNMCGRATARSTAAVRWRALFSNVRRNWSAAAALGTMTAQFRNLERSDWRVRTRIAL
jgi:hypothetical protein